MQQLWKDELLKRFLSYVAIDTAAVEDADTYPSSEGQFELGKVLASELREMGAEDVEISSFGIVSATIPGNVPDAPVFALLAHMDTSPESPGCGIKPQIIENYQGGDLILPGDKTKVIRVEDSPQLEGMIGKTIITTDGTTLLGGDDKAGIAAIMTASSHLLSHPEIKHGPIRIIFSCDEEIGSGAEHLDVEKIGAVAAYTLDGESENLIEAETFSADLATVTVIGKNIHPGLAKGKMINAIRLASALISRLPWQGLSPESTEGKEGFIHPYTFEGGVDKCTIRLILRSFEEKELSEQAELLRQAAAHLMSEFPGSEIIVGIRKQYRNMQEALRKDPRAVDKAVLALKTLGKEPVMKSIRGGTDGSALTEKGLPTPNLSTGMHNFHSPLEFACLNEMSSAVDVVIALAKVWAKT
jgi:tripeptide aminopeptidase